MLLSILYILAGLGAVLWGADCFTDGASAMARKFHVSELVIGLTVVALGTSAPELAVSLMAQIQGASSMAVGNILGSNIFNTLAIVGITSMVAPILITRDTIKRDMPWCILASVLLVIMMLCSAQIARWEAAILLACMAGFMYFTLRHSSTETSESQSEAQPISTWKSVLRIIIGLAALVIGSRLFVNGATSVGQSLGVSDAILGLTVAAWGTSLPELATSVSAARKGHSGLAIGNVVGSNIFNILFILGLTGIVRPLDVSGFGMADVIVFLVSVLLLWFFTRTKYKVERWEGAVLTLIFAAYTVWLILSA